MKRIVLGFILALISLTSFSQLMIDEFYEDVSELLIYREVIEIEATQNEIQTKIKEWSGKHFANASEVLNSETDGQIVFDYITQAYYVKPMGMLSTLDWHIKLIIQFRDNRFRVSFFDSGNAYWPNNTPPTRAKSIRFKDYFNKKGVARKVNTEGMIALKEHFKDTVKDIENTINGTNESLSDDW